MPDTNDYAALAAQAAAMTDQEFGNQFSSLTTLTNNDISTIITTTGISQQDLASVFAQVKNATNSNTQIAANISNINKGVDVLVSIAKKFL